MHIMFQVTLLYLFYTGEAPLTAVQLLWVNLIMDTLGALALATEPPYDALMEKPPVGRKGSFITNVMWRNIVGQAIYQLIVLWVLQFAGIELLHLGGIEQNHIHRLIKDDVLIRRQEIE